jgi:hypothetical protein
MQHTPNKHTMVVQKVPYSLAHRGCMTTHGYYEILDCTHGTIGIPGSYTSSAGNITWHLEAQPITIHGNWRTWLKNTGFNPNGIPQAGVLWATHLSHIESTTSHTHNTTKRTITMRWHTHSKPSCLYSQNTQNTTAPAQALPARIPLTQTECSRIASQRAADPALTTAISPLHTKHSSNIIIHTCNTSPGLLPTPHARANLPEKNTHLNP